MLFRSRYAGIRTTPNGNTHVRVTAYALPYATMVASIPFSVGCGMFVPIDDENCWRYFSAPWMDRKSPVAAGGSLPSASPRAAERRMCRIRAMARSVEPSCSWVRS